ncbi:exodeoxyribonuclease VII large subunit [Intestinibacillus massiliensis]|uniref:exodeoxyribonuclease VII large subunit n=1 Tax=Intestinibacillus massiliensis TaxID=1871029 RepID=UPI000B3503C2|nr:exodeoxyribonuclease VII large subunit [Intestinibacillus massiliensis]
MRDGLYTVTQLNNEIKSMLEGNPSFRNIFVQGEISNYKAHSSGHHYMTLKDEGAAISAVLFRSDAARLRFRLQNGMHVVARGRISSFPRTGQVQMYLADLMPDGTGALHMAFEQLKTKLYAEGMFSEARKRALPAFPGTVALITSPTGAAVRDMVRILGRRWPLAEVRVYPALVQGADAPADLCRALSEVNAQGEADLIIIGRGGGSMEDLWAFNEECVARAIAASQIPVVSAVGHEPDVTIADFVGDMRAPTPSGAAELTVPDKEEVALALARLETSLRSAMLGKVKQSRQWVTHLDERFSLRTPARKIADQRAALGQLTERLQLRTPKNIVDEKRLILEHIADKIQIYLKEKIDVKRKGLSEATVALDALSPLKVLARGYAVAFNPQGKPVMDSRSLAAGDTLEMRFARGAAKCSVLETRNTDEKETGL